MARYYNDFNDARDSDDELMHYGVQGMKWGIRKYVNYDGSLTAEGRRKYGSYQNFAKSSEGQKMLSQSREQQSYTPRYAKNQNGVQTRQLSQQPKKGMSTKKKVAIGAAVTAGVLATAGTVYAIHNHRNNMMEYESAFGNKAMQNMSAKLRNPSFDEALNAYKENAKDRAKSNVTQKVAETVKSNATQKVAETVKSNATQKVAETVKKSAQTGEMTFDDLLAQLSQDSKGGTGKGSSFKKAAQSVDDLTAELLKSNRQHLLKWE